MIPPPPWSNSGIVDGAINLVADVRDIDPNELIAQQMELTPLQLARRAVTLAALVDVDQPLSALLRWAREDVIKPRPKPVIQRCIRGHLMDDGNRLKNGFDDAGRQRYVCARCRSEQAKARREQRRAAATPTVDHTLAAVGNG